MKLLIVSAPRSGTMYAAHFFTALGIETVHEATFGLNGEHDWNQFESCSSWLAAPYLHEAPADLLILHQWRDIERAGASLERHDFFTEQSNGYTSFGREHVRISPTPNQGVKFIRKWHALIRNQLEGRTHIAYDVADLDVYLGTRICHFLGHEPTLWERTKAQAVPRNLHTNITPAVEPTGLLCAPEKIPDRSQARAGWSAPTHMEHAESSQCLH